MLYADGKVDVFRESLVGIAFLAVSSARAGDAIPPLDLKPGLWEITLTVQTGNQSQTAQEPQTTVKKSCLNEKQLHEPSMLTFAGEGCRHTILSASRSVREVRVDCGSQGGGNFRIEALDPEKAKISSDWSKADDSRAMKTTSMATLRWLGAVCESESPPAAEAIPPKTDASYYYNLGRDQAARNQFWDALRSLNRAIELDPQRATSYNARGYVYLRMQSFANAAVDFSDAIRLRPDYPNAYHNRAIARRHLGDEAGAAADNQKAAELEARKP
jgi:hypothetical protein